MELHQIVTTTFKPHNAFIRYHINLFLNSITHDISTHSFASIIIYATFLLQLNTKLLIVSGCGQPRASFIGLENNVCLWGDQAVNIEESVYILCQMLFI